MNMNVMKPIYNMFSEQFGIGHVTLGWTLFVGKFRNENCMAFQRAGNHDLVLYYQISIKVPFVLYDHYTCLPCVCVFYPFSVVFKF